MPETSFAASLLKNLGITGSGSATGSLVPYPDNPSSNELLASDFRKMGDVADPDIWNKYTSLMRRPLTYEGQLQLWDEMSNWDLMSAALTVLVDEVTQTDDSCPGTLWFEANDSKVEDEVNDMLQRIGSESLLPSQVWYTAGFGNNFEKIDYATDEGVRGLSFVHPMDVRRYWLERNRQCIGFKWVGKPANKETAFAAPDGSVIPRVSIGNGATSSSTEELYYPWDFLHFRRMYRNRFTEHGEAIFDEAQGIYKKMRMAIDMMTVTRAQIQPDRYSINIDVQNQIPRDQMLTVQRWKQSMRANLSFGPGGSANPNEFKSYYNPMALDTILWMAKPTGFTHTIEKIAGTSTIPDIYDIELLQNLFFTVIGMPKSWVMGTKEGSNPPSGKSLLAQDMQFLRKVKALRKPITSGYTWLAYFHCLLLKHDLSKINIKTKMSPIGALDDQIKMEVAAAQMEVISSMAEVMDKFQLPREAWIEVVFKKYMHLPDDVINTFMTSLPTGGDQNESKKPSRSAKTSQLLAEIETVLGGNPDFLRLKSRIQNALSGNLPDENTTPYRSAEQVLGFALSGRSGSLTENDLIRSSYQNDEKPLKISADIANLLKESKKRPVCINFKTADDSAGQSATPITESQPAYRRYLGPRL